MGLAAGSPSGAEADHPHEQGRRRRVDDALALASSPAAQGPLQEVLRWYFGQTYGRWEGPGTLPYYCDPSRVGSFAVEAADLAAGEESTLFKLFVTMSMYQALRDVVIMRQQRALPAVMVGLLTDLANLEGSIAGNPCSFLLGADAFDQGCNVAKDGSRVDCGHQAGAPCHVKGATVAFNRMGDMGKLPTSAWLRLWKEGGVRRALAEVCREEASPTRRAAVLVERFAAVRRVGRKLATMFVSSLSTPALAPGLTPWYPEVDGNDLIVVDTNVARAIDTLRPTGSRTYDAREQWIREQAAQHDLRQFHPDVPGFSPRLVQQALYAFCSKSNRIAREDACAERTTPCRGCAPTLCPFAFGGSLRDRAVPSDSVGSPQKTSGAVDPLR